MSPYLLLLTSVILWGIALWFRLKSGIRGEPGAWFFAWLMIAGCSAVFAAAQWWIGDREISLSFFTASHILLVGCVFVLFLFARSFSRSLDYTVFFWSVPLQYAVAQLIVNKEVMFLPSGKTWIFDMGNPFSIVNLLVVLFYVALVFYHLVVVYLTLRKEGRKEESKVMRLIILALLILFLVNVVGDQVNAALGYSIGLTNLGNVVGAGLLVYAFGPRGGGRKKGGSGMEEDPEDGNG